MAGRKVFVGSLPHNISDSTLRATFEQYGQVEDVFIKPGCEFGRQWAFVTFASPEQAIHAKECCDRVLTFPDSERPCDVMVAKNQGMYGQANEAPAPSAYGHLVPSTSMSSPTPAPADGPKKIFVGSLPDDITEDLLRAEFSKYGNVVDVFIKTGCERGRQWAFLTFTTHSEAQLAKVSTDRILFMPGASKVCEVTLARNQGMFGQDPIGAVKSSGSQDPRKIFVGSLPDHITESALRTAFQSYGEIVDVFIKPGCEAGRQWAFITYSSGDQANYAKESTDRTLTFAGADRPCEVMLARNQGKFGQEPLHDAGPPSFDMQGGAQPPPPTAPPPAHLTTWRCYYTVAGLPYYHNHSTGVTQWECPPELAPAGGAQPYRPDTAKRGVVRPAAYGAPSSALRQARTVPY